MKDNKIKVIVVTGPTATGKTSLAVKLAKKFNGEIISADSRQVYKGLDIGTGKDIEEYKCENINYHLIDIIAPNNTYNLRQFNLDAKKVINDLNTKKILPIISGGTVSYIDSLISNYEFPLPPPDEELRLKLKDMPNEDIAEYLEKNYYNIYKEIDNIKSRPRLLRYYEKALKQETNPTQIDKTFNFSWLILGTFYPREIVHKRIKIRLDKRLQEGMIEEVQLLHKNGLSWEKLDLFGLEYRYISEFLRNKVSYDEMYNTLLARIRKLARNQDIWFRKLENSGHKIYWIPEGKFDMASELVEKFLNNKALGEPEISLKNIYYGPKSKK